MKARNNFSQWELNFWKSSSSLSTLWSRSRMRWNHHHFTLSIMILMRGLPIIILIVIYVSFDRSYTEGHSLRCPPHFSFPDDQFSFPSTVGLYEMAWPKKKLKHIELSRLLVSLFKKKKRKNKWFILSFYYRLQNPSNSTTFAYRCAKAPLFVYEIYIIYHPELSVECCYRIFKKKKQRLD